MKLYKLTNQEGLTHGKTQWGANITHSVELCDDPELCTSKVLHAYRNINLGLLMNPIYGDIQDPIIWEAEGDICVEDAGKVGCFQLTTIRKLKMPKWYAEEISRSKTQIQFAILCAEKVLHIYEEKYPQDNRPRKAIEAAKDCLNARFSSDYTIDDAANAAEAAEAAAYDATNAAANAANAAYDATNAAANAANAAANAANAAVNVADAADHAANAVAAAYGAAYAAAATYNAATACANNNTYSAAYAANAAFAAEAAACGAANAAEAAEAATAVDVAESVATKINNIIVDNTINFGAIADQAVEIIMVGQKKKKEKKKLIDRVIHYLENGLGFKEVPSKNRYRKFKKPGYDPYFVGVNGSVRVGLDIRSSYSITKAVRDIMELWEKEYE